MNKKISITLGILLLLTIFAFIGYIKVKKQYMQNMQNINLIRSVSGYTSNIEHFYIENGEYPISLDETHPSINEVSEDEYEGWRLNFFIDCLSDKQKGDILYLPIYDRNTKKRIAALLLSAGIDGKLNTKSDIDTLFADNFLKDLRLYNYNNFSTTMLTIIGAPREFSIKEYLFGKKDYIIELMTPITPVIEKRTNQITPYFLIESGKEMLERNNIKLNLDYVELTRREEEFFKTGQIGLLNGIIEKANNE